MARRHRQRLQPRSVATVCTLRAAGSSHLSGYSGHQLLSLCSFRPYFRDYTPLGDGQSEAAAAGLWGIDLPALEGSHVDVDADVGFITMMLLFSK